MDPRSSHLRVPRGRGGDGLRGRTPVPVAREWEAYRPAFETRSAESDESRATFGASSSRLRTPDDDHGTRRPRPRPPTTTAVSDHAWCSSSSVSLSTCRTPTVRPVPSGPEVETLPVLPPGTTVPGRGPT